MIQIIDDSNKIDYICLGYELEEGEEIKVIHSTEDGKYELLHIFSNDSENFLIKRSNGDVTYEILNPRAGRGLLALTDPQEIYETLEEYFEA